MIAIISYISYLHITYKGHRFRLRDIDYNRVVLVDSNGLELIAERSERDDAFSARNVTIYVFEEVITHELKPVVDEDDDSLLAGAFADRAWIFTFPDGREVLTEWLTSGQAWRDDRQPATPPVETDEWVLYQTLLDRYLRQPEARSWFIGVALGSFAFLALGAWYVTNPRSTWEIEHMFSVKNGEPTEFALAWHSLRGYAIIIGTLIFVYIFYIVWQ